MASNDISGAIGFSVPPTPLLRSTPLSARLKKDVFLKLDCFRPSGSFKDRGIGLKLARLDRAKFLRVVSSSGGNAGLAVAYCGRLLGFPVTVVVPETTKALMLDKIRAEGAEVMVHGANWNAADDKARELIAASGGAAAYVHPFDDEVMWRGHASLVHETREQMREFFGKFPEQPDAILVAVGGGGLLSGVAQGLKDVGWTSTHIITAETHGADCLAKSVASKKLVTLDSIDSIATSLGARCPCKRAFYIATGAWPAEDEGKDGSSSDASSSSTPFQVKTAVVSDKDSVDACLKFADDHRITVEPACGAALSLLYQQHDVLSPYKTLLAVACGGSGVSLKLFEDWRKQYELS